MELWSPAPKEGDIPHRRNGKTYWFSRDIMDTYDCLMQPCIRRGAPCFVRLINRYADMPQNDEGGLHLDLRYEEGYADAEHLFINPDPYKKITHAIRAMDTEEEARWIAEARAYIEEALFDSLVNPSVSRESTVSP